MPGKDLNLKDIPYPWYSKLIGYIFTLSPLLAIPGCALYQGHKNDWNWKVLLNADSSYYDNYRKFLRSKETDEKNIAFDNTGFYNSQAVLMDKGEKEKSVTYF